MRSWIPPYLASDWLLSLIYNHPLDPTLIHFRLIKGIIVPWKLPRFFSARLLFSYFANNYYRSFKYRLFNSNFEEYSEPCLTGVLKFEMSVFSVGDPTSLLKLLLLEGLITLTLYPGELYLEAS